MRRFFSIGLVGVFLVVAPEASRAQTPGAVDPGAGAVVGQARRDRELGRLEQAIDGFARAYQLSGDSSLLFDMAETNREAGHGADALRLFQTYLRRDPKGSRRESAEKQIKELEREAKKGGAGVVAPVAAGGTSPAPAAVTRPAARVATKPTAPPPVPAPRPAPAAVALPPPVPLPPTQSFVVLPPPAAAPPQAPLAAPVSTPPSPPPLPPPPAPQPEADLSPPIITTTTLSSGDPATDVPPAGGNVSTPLPRWVPWTLAAATVALGTGAIVSGLSASSRYDELNGSCGQTPGGCAAADIDDVKSRALRANILWALTSVAAIGTGVTVYVNVHAAGVAGLWRF